MSKKEKENRQLTYPELHNWYDKIPKKFLPKQHNPYFHIHHIKLPFRMLITGSSGSGKTQTLL